MLRIPLDHVSPHWRNGDDSQDVEQIERGQDSQDDEPEPQEDVDLLVDDVEGQDAHGVVTLDRAGGTVFVEVAFGHSERIKLYC